MGALPRGGSCIVASRRRRSGSGTRQRAMRQHWHAQAGAWRQAGPRRRAQVPQRTPSSPCGGSSPFRRRRPVASLTAFPEEPRHAGVRSREPSRSPRRAMRRSLRIHRRDDSPSLKKNVPSVRSAGEAQRGFAQCTPSAPIPADQQYRPKKLPAPVTGGGSPASHVVHEPTQVRGRDLQRRVHE
mgnify:CR=1 FL=1